MILLPFSGAIPSLTVSKSSLANNLAGGIVNNAITSGVNVAFNPQSGQSFLGGVLSPGLLSTGTVGVSRFLTNNLVNSKALGPFGPLATDLAQTAVTNLSQDLLRRFLNVPGSQSSKYFPGGGNEPPVNFGGARGYSYSAKPGGTDLVFQIRKYGSPAAQQANAEVDVNFDLPSSGTTSLPFGNFLSAPEVFKGTSVSDNFPGAFERPVDFSFSRGAPGPSVSPPPSSTEGIWTFICAPGEVSWETSVSVNRMEIFGSNTPPVISGSRGMRELTLSNAIVEGFNRNVTVEKKIIDLEKLLKLTLDGSGGNVTVPVFNVCAGEKKYGGADNGLFVIKDIKVKEELRDLSGNTTRAVVDVSFSQVPLYQVTKQRDLASQSAAGAKTKLSSVADAVKSQADKNIRK